MAFVNSSANPAKPGSYVAVWASGAGGSGGQQVSAGSPYYFCDCAIQTHAGSLYVSYFGAAPGMPGAVTQVNFQVQPQAAGGLSFWLSVNGEDSDQVFIFVTP